MARSKQATPVKRTPSSDVIQSANGPSSGSGSSTPGASLRGRGNLQPRTPGGRSFGADDALLDERLARRELAKRSDGRGKPAGLVELLVCVAGIYASFLSWAVLQERITTTPYGGTPQDDGTPSSSEMFRYSIFLNTVQSTFAAILGYVYLFVSTFDASGPPSLLPSLDALPPLLLVALTSTLSSPFGYASLAHIDYITFILAKSCKLLPVMALHLAIFRKRYPLYKYAVVGLVTTGVVVFTLHHPSTLSKRRGGAEAADRSSKGAASNTTEKVLSTMSGNSAWGLFLLSVNLLLDGLTNSTQDYIFQRFPSVTGPQMMCVLNLLNSGLTLAYLFGAPYLQAFGVERWSGVSLAGADRELSGALAFIRRHPTVVRDVVSFAVCGAVGQIFIFYTLAKFSSLLLTTVTVTRKMLTMILSVVWFGHRLTRYQWLGVAFVFSGVGAEAFVQKREKDLARAADKGRRGTARGEESKKKD